MFQKLGFSELGWVGFYGMCLTERSSRTFTYPQQTLGLTKLPVASFIDLSLIPCLGGNRRFLHTLPGEAIQLFLFVPELMFMVYFFFSRVIKETKLWQLLQDPQQNARASVL